MTNHDTTIDLYIQMWNETDADRRAAVIDKAWTPEATYADPVQDAEGTEALSAMVARVHEQFPGHRFRRTTAIDTHHDQVRFGWELVAPDGSITVAGIDAGAVAPDGRLTRITGFFGELAAA